MKTSLRRLFSLTVGFGATAALAHAHPGHDGHDLTWDFSAGHMAGHPLATLVCSLLLVAGAWGVASLVNAGGSRMVAAMRRTDSDRRR